MEKKIIQKLQKLFDTYPPIKLVYFFGSRANNTDGPLSDYDFAFYIDETNVKKIYDLKFKLLDALTRFFKTDAVDVVMLNTTQGSEFKYNIIKDGHLIFEREPYRVLIEPKILNEYFDYHEHMVRHGLTRA